MKKYLPILLSICLLLSLSVPVSANNLQDFPTQNNELTDHAETFYNTDIDLSTIPEIMEDSNIDMSIYAERLEEAETDLNTVSLQNKDGSQTLFFYSEPVKYIDEDGSIKDRSTELQKMNTSSVAYATLDNSVKTYYPNSFSDGELVLEYEENRISVKPIVSTMQDEIQESFIEQAGATDVEVSLESNDDNDSLIYPDVFGPDIDISYSPLLSGFKEDIVLSKPPISNRFSFFVDAGNCLAEITDGMVLFIDPSDNSVVAQMAPIYIYDSASTPNDSINSHYEIDKIADGKYNITIVADNEFLNAESTIYPVIVDPSLTFNTNTSTEEAILYSGAPSVAHGLNHYNCVGYYNSTYKIGRLLVKFPCLTSNSTYKGLSASEINSVKYYMYCDGTNNATSIRPYMYTGAAWSQSNVTYNSASWNGYTALSGMNATTVPNSAGNVAFDITAAAKAWKNGTHNISKGLMLKNSNESSSSYCKIFTSTEYGNKYGKNTPYVVVNYTKFNQYIANLRIYSYTRGPGKTSDGNIANDMTYNNRTFDQIAAMSKMTREEAVLYDMPPASSTTLPPQGPEGVIKHMMLLATEFTITDSKMRPVAKAMFDHFLDGTGTNFSNSTLTQRVKDHANTQTFVNKVKSTITNYIKQNGGNIDAFYKTSTFKDTMDHLPRPQYSSVSDMGNGLKICINDVWGYFVNITNYSSDGKTYKGNLHFTLYDHFGLDDSDLDKFGWTKEFSAWYVLQHYTNCKGKYRPFITYIEFDVPISGSI